MLFRIHFFPGLCFLLLSWVLILAVTRRLLRRYPELKMLLVPAAAISGVLQMLGYLVEFQRVQLHVPVLMSTAVECASVVECMWLIGVYFALLAWAEASRFQASRRAFFQAAGAVMCIAPIAGTTFGIVRRNQFRVSEVKIPVPNLPKDLDGLRIVQVTDIHLSPFLSEREFARVIDMANETRANLALVTGDLITRRGDPLDACLRQLFRLRADAGVLGCLGNHEVYAGAEHYVATQARRMGIQFLRQQAQVLQFGAARINFAGVDYQKMHARYLVGAEQMIVPGMLNVLLSHNPDVFPVAAAQGYDLTIAGHTHGGQVDVEILHEHMNVARYFTRYVQGLYHEGNSSIYVSNGIGTIGVPVRLGAPPEVSLLRLCAT
jgi:predicted MPP superfamily phosphohydrolase